MIERFRESNPESAIGRSSAIRRPPYALGNRKQGVLRRAQPWVATIVRTIYQQPSPEEIHAQHARMVGVLDERFPQAAELLADVGPTSWPSPPSPRPAGGRSDRTTRRSGSTRRSDAGLTWWASCRTGLRSRRLIGAVPRRAAREWQTACRYLPALAAHVGHQHRMEPRPHPPSVLTSLLRRWGPAAVCLSQVRRQRTRTAWRGATNSCGTMRGPM